MRPLAAPLLLGLIALSACASDNGGQGNRHPVTPTERFSIDVRPAPIELKLAPHGQGLSAAQQDALDDFAHRWMLAEGGGDITLKTPEHGGEGAYRTATSARDFLISEGVSAERLRIVSYDAAGDDAAPVIVGFMRYQAIGPKCGQVWGNLSAVADNHEYDNFGCAVTANLAAQVANPADILAPRASDPPDAQRRGVVLDKYRQGVLTSTVKDEQADGTFSKVGK